MDRITRKELKHDKFAEEVGQTVEYFSEHRRQLIRYAIAAGVVVVLLLAWFGWRRSQRAAREQALNSALEIQSATIGPPQADFVKSYPTEQDRKKATIKAFAEVASKYPGSEEGETARYYLGVIAADDAKLADAEKYFREVIDSGSANYASLAKLALAQIYGGEGKIADGEKLLRSLMAKPTDFVSREQATIALGKLLAPTNPAEARKLLEPLRTERSTVSRVALTVLGEIAQKK